MVSKNVTHFSSTWFEDTCRGLKISLLHFSQSLNNLNEQFVEIVKRYLLVSPGKQTVEAICNPLHFRHRMTLHLCVYIWMHHHENLGDLTFKLKTDPTEIYLEACNFPPPWNPEIPKILRNRWPVRYSGRHRKTRNCFKVDPAIERMNQ